MQPTSATPLETLEVGTRPWGNYYVLFDSERYKIKRIVVNQAQRLSYQMHYHRSEHWVITAGTARVTLNEREVLLSEGESIFVPCCTRHRLENPGNVPLVVIEVQCGEYLGEDDIIRFSDDYARVTKPED
ncbi:phosphomannose isomerase type II C-terminal cupin domain [Candidatus Cyanaurora vandensis]|uniref:phosphomannose isomerase type II C-terminal cupin domain n=1 Tax=Candidatus Cyanaurora vandensis TaxID=2714958 RepID=UPI00257E444E|nr:phosphomannose isomerase type II C-terminal cupin domain [Candidatus Cyanaurora vandensis]